MLLLLRPTPEAALTHVASEVPTKPLLKPWFRLATTAEGLLVEHGRTTVTFGGPAATKLLPTLLPLLDGERTVAEIVEITGRAAEPAVDNALTLLARHGLLTDGPPLAAGNSNGLRQTAVYLAQGSPDSPRRILDRLESARVLVEGDPELVGSVDRLLHGCGVARSRSAKEATFVATATTLAGDPRLDRRNETALEQGTAWLPVGCFDGRSAAVGPLIVPHETACYRCWVLRRDASTACAVELRSLRSVPPAATAAPVLVALVAAIAAERIVRWIGVRDPSLPGAVATVEITPGFVVATDVVLRVPRCPACSGLEEAGQPVPWHEQAWGPA